MKNEDSRRFIRLYKGRNYVLKFQDILHWSKHLKRQRKHIFQHKIYTEALMRTEGGPQKL